MLRVAKYCSQGACNRCQLIINDYNRMERHIYNKDSWKCSALCRVVVIGVKSKWGENIKILKGKHHCATLDLTVLD